MAAQGLKPRLRPVAGRWWCESDFAVGMGSTVLAAWGAWKRAMEEGWFVVKARE
jgi:hypothetical protein